MSRKIKTQMMAGRPIVFDFNVEGEVIAYEMICPNCHGKRFVISLDKSRICCTKPDCLSVMCVRPPDTQADVDNIGWKI